MISAVKSNAFSASATIGRNQNAQDKSTVTLANNFGFKKLLCVGHRNQIVPVSNARVFMSMEATTGKLRKVCGSDYRIKIERPTRNPPAISEAIAQKRIFFSAKSFGRRVGGHRTKRSSKSMMVQNVQKKRKADHKTGLFLSTRRTVSTWSSLFSASTQTFLR